MRKTVRSTRFDGKDVVLYHKASGLPVKTGDTVADFRGETATVTGGKGPHKPSSTGRIYTKRSLDQMYSYESFPTVFNCEWRVG